MDTQVASTSQGPVVGPAPAPSVRAKYLLLSLLIASRWVVYGFTDVALTAVLRKSGVSLTQISLMLGVGFLFMFNLVIGMMTPPVGVLFFVMSGITRVPMGAIIRESMPFVIFQFAMLLLCVAFPSIVTALPRALGF